MIVGGCAGLDTSIFGATATTGSVPDTPKMRVVESVPLVALKPLVGPPTPVTDRIVRSLNEVSVQRNIALVTDASVSTPASLTGYLVARNEGRQIKLTYVWDMLRADGVRLERISGDELFPVTAGDGDVWGSIPPTAYEAMSERVITAVGAVAPR